MLSNHVRYHFLCWCILSWCMHYVVTQTNTIMWIFDGPILYMWYWWYPSYISHKHYTRCRWYFIYEHIRAMTDLLLILQNAQSSVLGYVHMWWKTAQHTMYSQIRIVSTICAQARYWFCSTYRHQSAVKHTNIVLRLRLYRGNIAAKRSRRSHWTSDF